MGNWEWIITSFGLLTGLATMLCTVGISVLVIGGIGYFLYRRNQQSMTYRQSTQTWLTTTGTVLMSSVQSSHSGNSHSTYPVVVYSYTVNGQSYQSQRVRAGDQFLTVRVAGQAQATVARYPIGKSITVYYDPANPAESALER
jgi:hypothetical protein